METQRETGQPLLRMVPSSFALGDERGPLQARDTDAPGVSHVASVSSDAAERAFKVGLVHHATHRRGAFDSGLGLGQAAEADQPRVVQAEVRNEEAAEELEQEDRIEGVSGQVVRDDRIQAKGR